MHAARRARIIRSRAKENVTSGREGDGVHRAGQVVGPVVGVDTHARQISAEPTLERLPNARVKWLPMACFRADALAKIFSWPGARWRPLNRRVEKSLHGLVSQRPLYLLDHSRREGTVEIVATEQTLHGLIPHCRSEPRGRRCLDLRSGRARITAGRRSRLTACPPSVWDGFLSHEITSTCRFRA